MLEHSIRVLSEIRSSHKSTGNPKTSDILDSISELARLYVPKSSIQAVSSAPIASTEEFQEMSQSEMDQYIADRTFNDYDDETTKLRKIRLYNLKLPHQASRYVKLFDLFEQQQVLERKRAFAIEVWPNQTRLDFIMQNMRIQHLAHEEVMWVRRLAERFQQQF